MKELSQEELLNTNGGWSIFDGVEWWDGSGSNAVVGLANAAYNAGVIAGNLAEGAYNLSVSAILVADSLAD